MTGKGFGGFEIFKSGIFLGRRFSQVFFGWLDLSRDFLGIHNNLKICVVPENPGHAVL